MQLIDFHLLKIFDSSSNTVEDVQGCQVGQEQQSDVMTDLSNRHVTHQSERSLFISANQNTA